MDNKTILYGCRKCFQKFKQTELFEPMQFCHTCQNSSVSSTYKQCNYCKADYKSNIPEEICSKCKNQLHKHGEPSNCSICKLKMVFGNAVTCVRCSHYRSKFGDARECNNCGQLSAFFKDNISREKVDGKIFCWLCTYFYKLHKCKLIKSGRERRVDVLKQEESPAIVEEIHLTCNDSSSLLSSEPINKRSRVEDETALMIRNDAVYNEHLLKVNTLQEDIKQFRRRIITKDNELMAKDSLITGLKADLLQKDKDFQEREMTIKSRWEKERQSLTDKIRSLQRENVNIVKSTKKKRPVDAGFHYLTKNPLTRVPTSITDSPEVIRSEINVKDETSSAEDSPQIPQLE